MLYFRQRKGVIKMKLIAIFIAGLAAVATDLVGPLPAALAFFLVSIAVSGD